MEKKKLMRTKPVLTIEEQERALEQLNASVDKREPVQTPAKVAADAVEKSMYSYNVKLDQATENRIKVHIAQTGQNMKGFFQIAIREYLDNHGA